MPAAPLGGPAQDTAAPAPDRGAPNAGILGFLYGRRSGRLLRPLVTNHATNWTIGLIADSPLSRPLIAPFARSFHIDLADCARKQLADYRTLNDFFTRALEPGARPICAQPGSVASPADGHLTAIPDLRLDDSFTVKGIRFDLARFLGDPALAARFEHGTMLIFRLAPDNYHRFHFPVAGCAFAPKPIRGRLHSVAPVVYASGVQALLENERHLVRIQSPEFSEVAVVSVGAMGVGRIVETYRGGARAAKGDEMGLFKYGGSTIAVLFQPGRVALDPVLVARSAREVETEVRMGEVVAFRRGGAQESATNVTAS